MEKLFTAQKIADALEKLFTLDHFIQWDGTNLEKVILFTGTHENFKKWFLSWEQYCQYVKDHGNIFKIFCENGHYEVPVGSWIVKAPDGKCYACGEGVKYVYDGVADMAKILEEIEIPINKEPETEPITFYIPEDPYETEVVDDGHGFSLRRKLDENGNPIWKKGYNPGGRWKATMDTAKGKDWSPVSIHEGKKKEPWMDAFKREVDKWK